MFRRLRSFPFFVASGRGGSAELPGFFVLYIGPSGKVQYRDKLLYLY
nr:MAG TPA: hypothetical protein [Caudoviricetes sp.]